MWFRPVLAFSSFAVLAVGFGIGLIWVVSSPKAVDLAQVETPKIIEQIINKPKVEVNSAIEPKSTVPKTSTVASPRKVVVKPQIETAKVIETKTATPKIEPKIIQVRQTKIVNKQTRKSTEIMAKNNQTNNEEVKTEFISLSYLPTPESGQVVRVKVPRAMMVSLGVSNNVSKNAEMVNAEVILGDDGTSRAIRFISTNNK